MLRVLTYHRVCDASKPELNPRLVSATPAAFARQMEFLASHYSVVSAEQVLAAVTEAYQLPSDAVLITFDDGYRDFRDFAWPVLRHYGLPAILFVPTAFADGSVRGFWWDRLHNAIAHTNKTELRNCALGRLSLASMQHRRLSLRIVQDEVKTKPYAEAMALVDEICVDLGVHEHPESSVLNWHDLRNLSAEGLTVAPHSRVHPVLTSIPKESLSAEVAGSRDDIVRELGSAVPIFSYPNGSHDDWVVASIRTAGFKLAFTTLDGHNDLPSADPLRLRRTNITMQTTLPLFALRLSRFGPRANRLHKLMQ